MRIAFYRWRHGNVFDEVIDICSGTARSGSSHVEAVFSDGVWFSSVPGIGPRFSPTLPDPIDCWDFYEWPCTPEQESAMYAWAVKQVGGSKDEYDWRGDLNFLVPVGDPGHKLFCSKAVVMMGQVAGFFPNENPSQINPDVLEVVVKALGWKAGNANA